MLNMLKKQYFTPYVDSQKSSQKYLRLEPIYVRKTGKGETFSPVVLILKLIILKPIADGFSGPFGRCFEYLKKNVLFLHKIFERNYVIEC